MTVAARDILLGVVAMLIGYVLGSVLPAELLARRRGVDIGSVGDGNPGTVNAFRGLGRVEGTITLVYDASVGVVAILIARALGVSEGFAYLAGIMAVVGHRLPVFSRFRGGGQGMAASAGLLVYGAGVAFYRGWLSVGDFALIAVIAVVVVALTRSANAVGLAILPVLWIELLRSSAEWQLLVFMTAVTLHIWTREIIDARRDNLVRVMRPIWAQRRR